MISQMELTSTPLVLLLSIFTCLFLTSNFISATESDVNCLRSIKDSFEDPSNTLSSWDFSNSAPGFICKFNGVVCWNSLENRVLNLELPNMGLKGKFPLGVADCNSITGLDLSGNELYGTVPSNISMILPFLTFLDLSSNNFSGQIPTNLANCSYLNVLKLDNNQLSGEIPQELALLQRLRTFSVANNSLTGPVPRFKYTIPAESYSDNPGLCGKPLPPC